MEPIICFSNEYTEEGYIPPPDAFLQGQVTGSSDIVLLFQDSVPSVAEAAMTYAASIWETRLRSAVPIRVEVDWRRFDEKNILASAGPTTLFRDFPGAIGEQIWYPVPIAESILGENLNEDNPDIRITVNSNANWYYGLDGQVPQGRVDLVSVVLHELGHGLGFLSSADTIKSDTMPDLGVYGFSPDLPIIFDVYMETVDGLPVTEEEIFPNPGPELFDLFTSGNLYFGGPLAIAAYGGQRPPLFSPAQFDRGSSISHVDEVTFGLGIDDALMSPRLSRQEAIHNIGEVTLAIMAHLGWDVVFDLTPVRDPSALPLAVYPNPAFDRVSFELPAGGEWLLRISDAGGRLLRQSRFSAAGRASEPVGELAPGWYLLSLSNGKEFYRSKLIVK